MISDKKKVSNTCMECGGAIVFVPEKGEEVCNQCGLVTDIRRKERFREKKKKLPKEDHRVYEPVTAICSCGEVLLEGMKNPWSEEKEKLKRVWKEHYCKKGVTKEELRYL